MNPVTPPSIALTAATPPAGRLRLALPAWTACAALAAAGVLAGAALLPRVAHAQAGGNAPVRIGVVGPFTGPSADFGVPMLNGIKRGLFSNEAGMGSAPNCPLPRQAIGPGTYNLVVQLGNLRSAPVPFVLSEAQQPGPVAPPAGEAPPPAPAAPAPGEPTLPGPAN